MQMPRGGGVELSGDFEQKLTLFRWDDTAEIAELKAAAAEGLPAEARALLPEGTAQAPEMLTLKMTCPRTYDVHKDMPIYLKASRAWGEGEKATVLLALPAEGKTEWLLLEGVGLANGSIQVMLSPDQIKLLNYQVFLVMIL